MREKWTLNLCCREENLLPPTSKHTFIFLFLGTELECPNSAVSHPHLETLCLLWSSRASRISVFQLRIREDNRPEQTTKVFAQKCHLSYIIYLERIGSKEAALTFSIHEFFHELLKRSRIWMTSYHLKEIIIRNNHIFGIPAKIDHLKG